MSTVSRLSHLQFLVICSMQTRRENPLCTAIIWFHISRHIFNSLNVTPPEKCPEERRNLPLRHTPQFVTFHAFRSALFRVVALFAGSCSVFSFKEHSQDESQRWEALCHGSNGKITPQSLQGGGCSNKHQTQSCDWEKGSLSFPSPLYPPTSD